MWCIWHLSAPHAHPSTAHTGVFAFWIFLSSTPANRAESVLNRKNPNSLPVTGSNSSTQPNSASFTCDHSRAVTDVPPEIDNMWLYCSCPVAPHNRGVRRKHNHRLQRRHLPQPIQRCGSDKRCRRVYLGLISCVVDGDAGGVLIGNNTDPHLRRARNRLTRKGILRVRHLHRSKTGKYGHRLGPNRATVSHTPGQCDADLPGMRPVLELVHTLLNGAQCFPRVPHVYGLLAGCGLLACSGGFPVVGRG